MWGGERNDSVHAEVGNGLCELVLLSLHALDPSLVKLLAPTARDDQILRRKLVEHEHIELKVILG